MSVRRQRAPAPLTLEPAMTPHEQVLRARLERVLQSQPPTPSYARSPSTYAASTSSRRAYPVDAYYSDSASDSEDDDSVEPDSDENVVRDENGGRACWRRPARPSTTTTTTSSSSRSRSQDRTTRRSRSRTSPNEPIHRRSSTTANLPTHYARHHRSARRPTTGTTPPLMSDGSPTPSGDSSEELDSPDERLLITPPQTPSHHQTPAAQYAAQYQAAHAKSHGKFHHPAEYAGQYVGHKKFATRVPVEDSDEDSEGEAASYFSNAQTRYPHPTQGLPTCPNQFNVRRASKKCKEIEGLVSFASIEGLGAPPENDSSEEEARLKEGKKSVWSRIWPAGGANVSV